MTIFPMSLTKKFVHALLFSFSYFVFFFIYSFIYYNVFLGGDLLEETLCAAEDVMRISYDEVKQLQILLSLIACVQVLASVKRQHYKFERILYKS